MNKLRVYFINFFAKLTLNLSIILLVLLLVFTCARMIVLELNVNALEEEITYIYQKQKRESSFKKTDLIDHTPYDHKNLRQK